MKNIKKRGYKKIKPKKLDLKIIILFALIVLFLISFTITLIISNYKERKILNEELPTIGIFAGGAGTLENPYIIQTCQELQDIWNDLNAYYVLANNIDCTVTKTWNWNNTISSYMGFFPIGNKTSGYEFQGHLNGNNFNITNLYIYRPEAIRVGLFGETSSSSVIKNLKLIDVNITGYESVGGIAGVSNAYSIIENSFVKGVINGNTNVGGISGFIYGASISNCSTDVNINAYYIYGGGLVGQGAFSSIITDSYAIGSVFCNDKSSFSENRCGGFIGGSTRFLSIMINNCYSNVNVTCLKDECGGFIGYIDANSSISNSYSIGNINGLNKTGGFVGILNNSNITNSFSTVNVICTSVACAGFAGYLAGQESIINSSYFYNRNDGKKCIGVNDSSQLNCTGYTTVDAFYNYNNLPVVLWNFSNKWDNVNQGLGYPQLIWEKAVRIKFCGDGTCDSTETCSSCPADCGSCPCTTNCNPRPGPSGPGPGPAPVDFWTKTFDLTNTELKTGVAKELSAKQRYRFNISGKTHYAGIVNLSNEKIIINTSSKNKQFTLLLTQDKKLDFNNDLFYDVYIKFGARIKDNKINFSIKNINESINPINNTNITPPIVNITPPKPPIEPEKPRNLEFIYYVLIFINIFLFLSIFIILILIIRERSINRKLRIKENLIQVKEYNNLT